MSGHFIVKCEKCQDIIRQCRCMGHKTITWELCTKCQDLIRKEREDGC